MTELARPRLIDSAALDCTALERGYVMRSLPRLAGTLERALRWGHLSAVVPRPVEEA